MPYKVADASLLGEYVYDASYLHLARSLGIPLITFDRHLQAAAEARGPSPA